MTEEEKRIKRREYSKRYREKNIEKVRERDREHKRNISTSEYKKRDAEKKKQWRQTNREKYNEKMRLYKQNHPEQIKEYDKKFRSSYKYKKWKDANKEKANERTRLKRQNDSEYRTKLNESDLKLKNKQCKNLETAYIINTIKKRVKFGIQTNEIPHYLIDATRQNIILKRELKNINNDKNQSNVRHEK